MKPVQMLVQALSVKQSLDAEAEAEVPTAAINGFYLQKND